MSLQVKYPSKCLLWACIPFLALLFSLPAVAATPAASPKSGNYCPGSEILLVVAEELSASLDLVMRSKAALNNKDQAMVISKLTSAGTTLQLAASRGVAARTNLLIDAITQPRAGEDYAQMLAWFPLLQTSLLTIPDDATVSTAGDWIGSAEDMMQGDKDGDPMKALREARHMLACDGLDIPLQQAIAEQGKLMKQLGKEVKNDSYDALLNSLRSALAYALENSQK